MSMHSLIVYYTLVGVGGGGGEEGVVIIAHVLVCFCILTQGLSLPLKVSRYIC